MLTLFSLKIFFSPLHLSGTVTPFLSPRCRGEGGVKEKFQISLAKFARASWPWQYGRVHPSPLLEHDIRNLLCSVIPLRVEVPVLVDGQSEPCCTYGVWPVKYRPPTISAVHASLAHDGC